MSYQNNQFYQQNYYQGYPQPQGYYPAPGQCEYQQGYPNNYYSRENYNYQQPQNAYNYQQQNCYDYQQQNSNYYGQQQQNNNNYQQQQNNNNYQQQQNNNNYQQQNNSYYGQQQQNYNNYQQQQNSNNYQQQSHNNYMYLIYPQLQEPYDYRTQEVSYPTTPQLIYPTLPNISINNVQSISLAEIRKHKTIESALAQLNENAKDLSNCNPHNLREMENACFICCNTYTKEKLKLGVGPINDSISTAIFHQYMGYEVYYLHNTKPRIFMDFLKQFLRKTTKNLTVYYTGHGANIEDTNGDEDDGFDEVMVFDDGYIVDDDLAICIKKYHNGITRAVLISDCCHSGTIWDIPENPRKAMSFPANVVSISSSNDDQTSKQGVMNQIEQGIFTYHFWNFLKENPNLTFKQMEKKMDDKLTRYHQKFVATPTRVEILDQPIFPLISNPRK